MKISYVLYLMTISLILTGCGSTANGQPKIDYVIRDRADKEVISISLYNPTNEYICIDRSDWPNKHGRVYSESYIPILVADGERFLQKDFGEADCFDFRDEGLCSIKIPPGQTRESEIPYATFELPRRLYGAHKELIFFPPYDLSSDPCLP